MGGKRFGAIVGMVVWGILAAGPCRAENWIDECAMIGKIAEAIMEGRQNGTPLAETLRTIGKMNDRPLRNLAEALVYAAYEAPKFESPRLRAKMVKEFGEQSLLTCYRAYRKLQKEQMNGER